MPRSLLLLSTSTVHGSPYLAYCAEAVQAFLQDVQTVLFVPYARPGGLTHEAYTGRARTRFTDWGKKVSGLDEVADPVLAVEQAEAVFIGGGNTFVLQRALYEAGVVEALRERVQDGMLYMGTSAGSNVAGHTIGTTNDMPIVYPPTFEALGLVPFNINPHYLDPDPASTHMGETRATRIAEFHLFNQQPVVGLREGAWLRVEDETMTLEGEAGGRLFRPGEEAKELTHGTDLSELL